MTTPHPREADTEPAATPVAVTEPTANAASGPEPATEADSTDTSVDTAATALSTVDAPPSEPDGAASVVDTSLVEAAAADAATDLARTDVANTTLATLAGVLLTILVAGAGLTTGDGSYPTAALAAMGTAAALLAAVLVVLTTAMWPRRGGTGGVPHYATLTPAQLVDELAAAGPAHWHAERATVKARIAARKHTAQRLAGAGLSAAGVLLAVATIWTLAT